MPPKFVSYKFSGTYAPHFLFRYHNVALVCGAGVLLSECGIISEMWGELLTKTELVYFTKNAFQLGSNVALVQIKKDLYF